MIFHTSVLGHSTKHAQWAHYPSPRSTDSPFRSVQIHVVLICISLVLLDTSDMYRRVETGIIFITLHDLTRIIM